jgi:ABC-type lipoprotein export system ATPase subunit
VDDKKVEELLGAVPLSELFSRYPYIENLFEGSRLRALNPAEPLTEFLSQSPEEYFSDYGFTRAAFAGAIIDLIEKLDHIEENQRPPVSSLTILGGKNKDGVKEDCGITIHRGEIVAIVGPTGAGKTRLLEDIECLAQGDTPTGRRVLIDNTFPGEDERWHLESRMVAQLSQNMNFVIDLPVREFLCLHAESRTAGNSRDSVFTDELIAEIIACANTLAGEKFDAAVPVTQLSGGQSRALMIADTALLSESPIILIDEIENAGIDRRKALELLAGRDKMVLISTHDPALALMGERRVIIQNGGILDVLERTEEERRNLSFLESLESYLLGLRDSIRQGRRIDGDIKHDVSCIGEVSSGEISQETSQRETSQEISQETSPKER